MRVGTDFSGIDTPLLALQGIPFTHVFSCEMNKHARDVLRAHHSPEHLYTDITERDHASVPAVDLYIAGFPCQAFSNLGKRKADKDPRGRLFDHVFAYLKEKRPKNILLENVSNLMTLHRGKHFKSICDRLYSIGYHLHYKVLNTMHYGLPQSRKRLYIVGFQTERPFSFPEPVPLTITLQEMYEREERPEVVVTKREQLVIDTIVTIMKKRGWDLNKPRLIDSVCSLKNYTRAPPFDDICTCVTTNARRYLWYKAGAPYSRASKWDLCTLQGIDMDMNKSKTQVSKLVGNAMSVPVIRGILRNMVYTGT